MVFFSHEVSTPSYWALFLYLSFLGSPSNPPNSSMSAEQQPSKLIYSSIFHLPFALLFLDSHFLPSSSVIFATGESFALSHAWLRGKGQGNASEHTWFTKGYHTGIWSAPKHSVNRRKKITPFSFFSSKVTISLGICWGLVLRWNET